MTLMFHFALTCEWCGDGHIGIETSGRVPWGENSSRIGLFRTRFITDHWDRFVFVFFSRVFKKIRWQLKVPGMELFTLVSSLLVSSHGQVEVRVGNILGSASPKAPVCVIRKPVCAKSSANFEQARQMENWFDWRITVGTSTRTARAFVCPRSERVFLCCFFTQNYVFEWVWGEPVWWAAKLSLGHGIMSVERFH